MNPCTWKRCRHSADGGVIYYSRPLCWRHWLELCELRDQGRTPEEILERHTADRPPAVLRAG